MEKIKQTIAGREAAEMFIAEYTEGESEEWLIGFARACLKYSESVLKMPVDRAAMTSEEAQKYERVVFTYGKHKDKSIGDIPMSYLNWIADTNRALLRYVDSQRGRERTEREEA
jgi:hypothetical protein